MDSYYYLFWLLKLPYPLFQSNSTLPDEISWQKLDPLNHSVNLEGLHSE